MAAPRQWRELQEMAYAYRSTGRDTVVITDRTRAQGLAFALKAVLSVAKKHGMDLNELTEAAADELLQYRTYASEFVPMAIHEIEVAVDALQV